ncbi:Noc2-domain-containing protein, partial [Aureobasidium melanogenum]
MAQTKATKKFEKNHLKDTIKRRKDFAKIKQRHQLNAKRKAKRAQDNEVSTPPPEDTKAPAKDGKQDFESMNVDDFFQGGFDVPELPAKSDKSLKRKRAAKTDDKESQSTPAAAADDDASDSDSEVDDPEAFQAQLDALAAKDPEFHKYMQEN